MSRPLKQIRINFSIDVGKLMPNKYQKAMKPGLKTDVGRYNTFHIVAKSRVHAALCVYDVLV